MTGDHGEEVAEQYLIGRGYTIVSRNFTIRGGEIDRVVRTGDTLVFVEVKTRTGEAFGRGEESLTRAKKQALRRAIRHYLTHENSRSPHSTSSYRVDLIDILLSRDHRRTEKITHFIDIPL